MLERVPSGLAATEHVPPATRASNMQEQADLNPTETPPTAPNPSYNGAQTRPVQDESECTDTHLSTRSNLPAPSLPSADAELLTEVITGFADTTDREEGDG